ncbi:MAG: GNAT family N-acetyltransferase [Planctomycetes bacterium]|nr:GNAT family N-acetyltransferase [Planctomycetota bacterium]
MSMSIGSATDSPHVLRVTDRVPRAVALAFLKGDPRENVYLISRIHRSGMSNSRDPAHGRFFGAFDQDQSLRGLCFLGNTGSLVLSVDEPWVAAEFVDRIIDMGPTFSILIGEWAAGREFLSRYRKKSGRRPTMDRRQIYYVIDSSSLTRKGIKEIDMEQASLDSIDELTELACAMVSEDLKIEPKAIDRRHYRLRMTEKVMEGRAYLCRNADGRAIFKCDMAAIGPEGALLEGVYTPTDLRGQGVATRALWTLCKDLLSREQVPFIALHVDEKNKAARAAYEKVGFRQVGEYRLALMPSLHG